MVRRIGVWPLSICVIWGVAVDHAGELRAQDVVKKAEAKVEAAAKTVEKQAEAAKPASPPAKGVEKKEEAKKEEPLKPIPPEVQAKLEAARRAVAELIVAAQDAGLVETSIDPPPILDILITGRAVDARTIKGPSAKKPYAVSPEVFAAWFTNYGKLEGVNWVDDVRILNPSAGLKEWYDQRARILDQYMQEIRKAKGGPGAKQAAAPAAKPAAAAPDAKKAEAPAAAPDAKKAEGSASKK